MSASISQKNRPNLHIYSPHDFLESESKENSNTIAEKLEIYFEKSRHNENLLKQEKIKFDDLKDELQKLKSINEGFFLDKEKWAEKQKKFEETISKFQEKNLLLSKRINAFIEFNKNKIKNYNEISTKWHEKIKKYYKNFIYFKKISESFKKILEEERTKKSQIQIELEITKSRNSFLENKSKEGHELHQYFQKKYINLETEMNHFKKKYDSLKLKLIDYQNFYQKNKETSKEVSHFRERYLFSEKENNSIRNELEEERKKNRLLNDKFMQEKREKTLALSYMQKAEEKLNQIIIEQNNRINENSIYEDSVNGSNNEFYL